MESFFVVSTNDGDIRGLCGCDGIVRFRSIPYAKAPVGNLRWRDPQSVGKWSYILDCTAYSKAAQQVLNAGTDWENIPTPYGSEWGLRKEELLSEDCLYLNIWVKDHYIKCDEKRPVVVIIHGGAFEYGSGAVATLDGSYLASQGIVVVTINYRLGIFGYLMHPSLSQESPHKTSGNYGFLDQLEALKWVQKNIEAFGGDPLRVTVSGESAGSISVNMLCESPLSKGLFTCAIAQSAAGLGKDAYCPQRENEQSRAEQRGLECMNNLGAYTTKAMRSLSVEALMAINTGFVPVRDGYSWPYCPNKTFRSRYYNDVPLLLGSNSDEGSAWAFFIGKDGVKERFIEEAQNRYGEEARKFLDHYPTNTPELAVGSICRAYGEKVFAYSIYLFAQLAKKYGKSKVYQYYYDYSFPGSSFGAYHSSELCFCLGTMDEMNIEWTSGDRHLRTIFSSYFVNFIMTGDPNGKDLPHWDALQDSNDKVLEIGENIRMIQHPSNDMFQIYMRQDGEGDWFNESGEI